MKFPDTERVVFAVFEETRDRFFPELGSPVSSAANVTMMDTADLCAERFAHALGAVQPTVLVTGWGTPALPAEPGHAAVRSLRYVCHLGGTVRPIVPRTLIESGLLVSNWGETISHTIAEHAVLLILGALRNTASWRSFMLSADAGVRAPKAALRLRSLRGKRVCIHGFGSIARALIPMLRAFQVQLSVYSAGVPAGVIEAHGVRCCASLEELVAGADVVVECEALSDRNRQSVDETVLRLLPDGAVFVNVGRGALVDETALIRVACEKNLRLGLDVYQSEPLPKDSGLFDLPCALLSPHVAGPTEDAMAACGEFALANLQRYFAGEMPAALVDLAAYDRST